MPLKKGIQFAILNACELCEGPRFSTNFSCALRSDIAISVLQYTLLPCPSRLTFSPFVEQAAEGADEYDQGWPRRHRNAEMVVGTSDGRVRVLAGPKRQECGLFAVLDSEMVLSIVELLGYRSSEVCVFHVGDVVL